jgi:cytochrome c oxidase cbb3-type subunit 4
MAIDDLRVIILVLAVVAFVGIVSWAYSRKRKRDFEEAAKLPFTGKDFGDAANSDKKNGAQR